MSNWKNVNNWHWTEKNCMVWANKFLTQELTNVTVDTTTINISIPIINSITGDCDLNHRKGKLFSIYDLKIELEFLAKLDLVKDIKGKLVISEICHDSEEDEIEFRFELDNNNENKEDDVLKLCYQQLIPKIKGVIKRFNQQLIHQHSKDVKLEKDQINQPILPNSTIPTQNIKETNLNGNVINLEYEIHTSCHDLYKVFTDPKLITLWSKSPTTFVAAPTLPFKMFSSAIKGTVIEVEKDHKIKLGWRRDDWPQDVISYVTITFTPKTKKNQKTFVSIEHIGYPTISESMIQRYWSIEVMEPILSTFQYSTPTTKSKNSIFSTNLIPITLTVGIVSAGFYYWFGGKH